MRSGLGGRFPANYPVATVVEVERRPGAPFARVIAAPRAQLDRSREVLLVWPDGTGKDGVEGDGYVPAPDAGREGARDGDGVPAQDTDAPDAPARSGR